MSDVSKDIWLFGPFLLNPSASELKLDGQVVAIEPQSLRLLEYLLRNRDRVVSRSELVEAIWFGRAVSDWAISGAVKALRASLGDTGQEKRYVRTIHSRGYRFVAKAHSSNTNAGSKNLPKILVRIFRTQGDDPEFSYLADGLAEDLITSLSRSKNWRVLSYNTSRALADQAPAADQGVSTIIDGSIRPMGDTLRYNVATLDGAGTDQSWAETFDLTKESLIAGHDLIAERLISVLSPGRTVEPANQRGTQNSQAYDHYQKGRYAYFRYEPAAFAEALTLFEAAVSCDPTFANAYAQQAYCRTTLYVFGLPGADKSLDAAEALARKAIQTDKTSALGYARLGWVLGYCGRPDDTIAAFETALKLAPETAEIYHAYGETMNRLADPKRAEPLLDAVFSKDSYFPPSWEFPQGHTRVLLKDPKRAIAHFESVLERLDRFIPAHVQLARAYWEDGDLKRATQQIHELKKRAPKYSLDHAKRMFPYPIKAEQDRLFDALKAVGLQ